MKPEYIQYQAESVARAKLPAVKRHSKPVKQTTQQKQTTGAAA
ncbi:hypothetical protein ACRARH_26055 [Phytobacter ursingii]